jgi:hypothetical protein
VVADLAVMEHADFAHTAVVLAPFGYGWSWRHVVLGARHVALQQARRQGAVAVVPRSTRLYRSPVQVLLPDLGEAID